MRPKSDNRTPEFRLIVWLSVLDENCSIPNRGQGSGTRPFLPLQLLTVPELCAVFGVSPACVYKRTRRGAEDTLSVFAFSFLQESASSPPQPVLCCGWL
jgi:hypothetical protein